MEMGIDGGVTHLCCLLRCRMLAKLFKLLLNRLLFCQLSVTVSSQVGKTLLCCVDYTSYTSRLTFKLFWDIFWGDCLETWKFENITKKIKAFTVKGVENVAKESDVNSQVEAKKDVGAKKPHDFKSTQFLPFVRSALTERHKQYGGSGRRKQTRKQTWKWF